MKIEEIKQHLKEGTWFYNDNDPEAIEFWKEAAEKCPKLVEEDFKELNNFCLTDEEMKDVMEGGFELNSTYKEIFKNLNLCQEEKNQ